MRSSRPRCGSGIWASRPERRGVPRIAGAILVLVGLVAIGAIVCLLVFGGISSQSQDIAEKLNRSLDKIQGWATDLGIDDAQSAKEDLQKAAPEIRTTLLSGVATGVGGLSSLVFFLGFATLSTLFVLKDGPVMRGFINRHLGVPEPVGDVVTTVLHAGHAAPARQRLAGEVGQSQLRAAGESVAGGQDGDALLDVERLMCEPRRGRRTARTAARGRRGRRAGGRRGRSRC